MANPERTDRMPLAPAGVSAPDPSPRTGRDALGVAAFGRTVAALVTPMAEDGGLDRRGMDALVEHVLIGGVDGLVVAGTTGEAPTLTEVELATLVGQVAARAGGRARVTVGVGTCNTAESVDRARRVAAAGADALLVVTPYYSRPTQAGIIAHVSAIAAATDLPVMLYDVPARTGSRLTASTLAQLSELPTVLALKDAVGDLAWAMATLADSSLAWFGGIDELNLPHLSIGACGLVSVVANVAPEPVADLVGAVSSGSLEQAARLNDTLLPLAVELTRDGQGAALAKAALAALGVISSPMVRLPLVPLPTPALPAGASVSPALGT